jgi:hypothetical protein
MHNTFNMKKTRHLLLAMLTTLSSLTFAQESKNTAYYFDDPIVVDSSTTIVFPVRYNSDYLSSNKIAIWGDYFANLLFYNIPADSYHRLFETNTYILRNETKEQKNTTAQYLFYRVKNVDYNKSGRIDNNDPAILYVSDRNGSNLKALTTENENVLSIDIFEKQKFVLVKVQRDHDNDGDYENSDKDFYYVKLDLTTMTFGKKIESR